MTNLSKLEKVRLRRLEGKAQSDNIEDNSKLTADKIPKTVSESIETFYKNKEVLTKLYPERILEFERLVSNHKNTLKFLEFEKVYSLISSLESKGYKINSEDTKRVFDYVINNPQDNENEAYLSRLMESLKLTKINRIKPVVASKIFNESNLTPNSSSMVMDTMFSLMIGKGLNIFQIGEKLCRGSKKFTNGDIDVIFRDIEFDLVSQYGEDTYQVFSILLAYWYKNKPQNWGETITLSGDEILEILNEKNKVIRNKDKTKRLSKIEGLNWVAHHCELLKGIRVYSSKIIPNGKGKEEFSIKENPLIEFSEIDYYPVGIKEHYLLFDNIEDLHISFKVGNWFKYFDDEKYIKQFGYVHEKAFSSNGIESNLLHWLSFKIEQNQKGEFKIKTILEQIGLKERLNEVLSASDPQKKSEYSLGIFRDFNRALEFITIIDDPYQWEYKNAPQWLLEDLRKPKGWLSSWFDVVIVFKHPQCLIAEGKNYKREKIKPEAKPEKIKTTEDLKFVMDKFKISIRDLVKKSDNKYTYYKLQKGLNKEGDLKNSEIRELITYCYQINQSMKK